MFLYCNNHFFLPGCTPPSSPSPPFPLCTCAHTCCFGGGFVIPMMMTNADYDDSDDDNDSDDYDEVIACDVSPVAMFEK